MLIISQHGRSARLDPRAFDNERALQRFIAEVPDAIPLDVLGVDGKLHILGRELQTTSGPLDALGTDGEGGAYLIEVKLYRNPDKRLVLAQVLDYGAALWAQAPSAADILGLLKASATRTGLEAPETRLAAFLDGDDEAVYEHLERVSSALSEGKFTAIVLMDRLTDQLRDLIKFMNENSRFRLLAVELDYYQHDSIEIVTPRLFGAETRRAVDSGTGTRGSWSEDAYFERLRASADAATVAAVTRFHDFVAPLGGIAWGTGAANPSLIPYFVPGSTKKSPLFFKFDGRCVLKLDWVRKTPNGPRFIEVLTPLLETTGLRLANERGGKVIWDPEVWVPKADVLIHAFRTAVLAVNAMNERGEERQTGAGVREPLGGRS